MANLKSSHKDLEKFYEQRYADNYMAECHYLELLKVSSTLDEVGEINGAVLDYGCGQGRWAGLLAQKFPNAKINGIDISANAIEKAKAANPKHNFKVFDGKKAPFADASFDLVFTFHVLEHVPDIKGTVSDIARLVKKGGRLCVIFPCGNDNSFEERVVRMIKGGMQTTADGGKRFFYEDEGHLRRMKSEEIIALFEKCGLSLHKEYYSNQYIGAVEWISRTSFSFIRDFFNSAKPVSTFAWMKLMILKLIFLVLVLRGQPFNFSNKSFLGKIMLSLFLPAKIPLVFIGKVLERLSYLEWRYFRKARNGSEQFLIFRR